MLYYLLYYLLQYTFWSLVFSLLFSSLPLVAAHALAQAPQKIHYTKYVQLLLVS